MTLAPASDPSARDAAFALKAVIQYFLNSKHATEEDIYEWIANLASIEERLRDGRQFMRANVKLTTMEQLYPTVRQAVIDFLQVKPVPIPAFLAQAAALAGLGSEPLADTGGLPSFLGARSLEEMARSQEDFTELLPKYEGFWRIYRVSNRSLSEREMISAALLNIKPAAALQKNGRRIPEFSLFQNDQPENGLTAVSETSGMMLSAMGYVCLLGGRGERPKMRPLPALMTWRHGYVSESDHSHFRHFRGMGCFPSSSGAQVAGYFVAQFVENSSPLSTDAYTAAKAIELKRIGSRPRKDIEAGISDPEVLEALARLIEDSREQRIFSL